MLKKTQTDEAYFQAHESHRTLFHGTMERLHKDIRYNLTERKKSLATKDLKLLRRIDASLTYLGSMYDNDWKICLPNLVHKYVEKIIDILEDNKAQHLEGDSICNEYFLSICDVAIILDCTDDIIHYLITEYDSGNYKQRRTWMSRFVTFMNSARSISDTRQKMIRFSDVDAQLARIVKDEQYN